MAKIDKTLKETLHCEDTKDEILEKYEQIMLDEHFNLKLGGKATSILQ